MTQNRSRPWAVAIAIATAFALAGCAASPPGPAGDPIARNTGVLVIGGTGQLGAYHVNQLIAAGERVIVLARPSSSFERLTGARGETYEVVIADLRNPDEVTSAIAEAKPAVIIDASNLPGIRMENGESFYWATMRNIVAAAEAHGVTQVIRHSPRGAREMLTEPPAAFRDDPRVINYMRDSARAEIALETAARNSPTLNSTIVLNRNLPPEPATATGNGTLSDDLNVDGGITRSDLARLANTCVLNPACYGRTFNAVDPTLPPPAR